MEMLYFKPNFSVVFEDFSYCFKLIFVTSYDFEAR